VFQVLEGRYLFEVDGGRFEAAAGDLISVPGGAARGFVNITDRPARPLVMILPAMDAHSFFAELARVFEAGQPTRDALNAFGTPRRSNAWVPATFEVML
jgi:mannose-6-phosphate isomerase-like protein (cupin superfamily)